MTHRFPAAASALLLLAAPLGGGCFFQASTGPAAGPSSSPRLVRQSRQTPAHQGPTLVLAPDADDAVSGRWTANEPLGTLLGRDRDGATLAVRQRRGGYDLPRVRGLPKVERADDETYELSSPAVTLALTGDGGDAAEARAGTYRLAAREKFFAEFAAEPGAPPEKADVLLDLLGSRVDADYVRAVAAGQGRVSWQDVARLRRAGLDAAFVTQLSAPRPPSPDRPASPVEPVSVGYSVEEIIRLGQYSIPVAFVDAWHAVGYGRGVDELIRLQSYSLSPKAAAAWNRVAGRRLGVDELIRVDSYSLAPRDAAAFKAIGYGFDIDRLIRLQSYSITPAYAEAMNEPGYAVLGVDELIRLQSYGVEPATVRALRRPRPTSRGGQPQ